MQTRVILLALATLFFIACRHKEHQHNIETEAVHEHASGEKYTVYSNRNELFMEASELEPGKVAEMLLHLTRLSDFKPVREAIVRVSLSVDGQNIGSIQAEPVRDGIYSCDLEINREGHGVLLVVVEEQHQKDTLIVPDIHIHQTHDDHDHAAEEAAEVNGITFTKEQQWKIDFATAIPQTGAFGTVIKSAGKVIAAPNDEVLITAKTNGIVSFSTPMANGTSVKKGQLIIIISGRELAENNSALRYQAAKSEYDLALANYERLKSLAAEKVVAEKDLLEAKSTYQTAKLKYELLDEQFNADGQKVVSPRSGYLKELMVQNGQYVEAGDPLCSVFSNQQIQIVADVAPKNLTALQEISGVNVEIPGVHKVIPLDSMNGKLLAIGKTGNDNNYQVPITFQLDQTIGIVPGSFVSVYIRTVSNSEAISVPNSALLEEQGKFYLFVQVHPELFEKQEVMLGASDGLRTEIVSGLSATDRIVTKGAVLVKLSKSAGALDAHSGHVH